MDIRDVSEEEKQIYITKVLKSFNELRNMLDHLEQDMKKEEVITKEDLIAQGVSVWISGQLVSWYYDFMTQIKQLEKNEIQQQIMAAANENEKELEKE